MALVSRYVLTGRLWFFALCILKSLKTHLRVYGPSKRGLTRRFLGAGELVLVLLEC